jgi:hypothetical protein
MAKSAKKSNQQVADIVESVGLGYAVQHYLGASAIKDPKLAALWRTAKETLDAIETLLPEGSSEEDEVT